ncbi:LIC_12616 family protein [Roseibium alexandrii]|uniref:phage neck terminator protein n=1 Tax=Roseibium alexandrii TaxID=388408 RepID=UPI0037514292
MTDTDVWEAFIRWLADQTGLKVIKAHQSGDRPSTPYLMVNFTAFRELREMPQNIEYRDTETLNSEGNPEVEATPVIEGEWDFSVHAYGDAPTDSLRKVKGLVHLSQRLEPLLPALTVHETGPINSVPDWVKKAWEPRAQMNVAVRGLIRDGAVVDVIEEYSIGISRA